MTYNLYIDELFLINLAMDCLVLSVAGKAMKRRGSLFKILLGSSVGALWAVVAAVFKIPLFFELAATYVIVPAVMVSISFALKRLGEIARMTVCLYLVTIMAAGAMEALYQHTKAGYYIELILMGNSREAMPLYRLLFLAAGIYFGLRYSLHILVEARGKAKYLYEVTLHYRGKEKTVTALLDTGNRLYEPVTRQPVHVVTYGALRDICESVSSVIYIPFGSVGKKSGVMPGIFLDEMEVRQGDEVRVIKKPLVAVCSGVLSADEQYQMLLHED